VDKDKVDNDKVDKDKVDKDKVELQEPSDNVATTSDTDTDFDVMLIAPIPALLAYRGRTLTIGVAVVSFLVLFFVDDFWWSKFSELFTHPGFESLRNNLTDLLPEPWKGYLVPLLRYNLLTPVFQWIWTLLGKRQSRRWAAALILVYLLAVFYLPTGPTDPPFKEDVELPGHYGIPQQEKMDGNGEKVMVEGEKSKWDHEIELKKLEIEAERRKEDSRKELKMKQLDQAHKREERELEERIKKAEEDLRRNQENAKAQRDHEIRMKNLEIEAEREKEDSRRRYEAEKERKEHELKMKQLEQEHKREHKREEREWKEKLKKEDEARRNQKEDYDKRKSQQQKDFTDLVLTNKVPVPRDLSMRVKTSNEKHFCRAEEGMEEDKYEEIIDNLADKMKLDDVDRKSLHLAKFTNSKVNVMEHYTEEHYAYLRYQILKTPDGKRDLTFAIHTTNFELLSSSTSTGGEITSPNQISENSDKELVKTHLRITALTKFEDDCPQQLFTDVGIQERKEAKRKASEKEEEERKNAREKEEKEKQKARKRDEERAEAEAKAEEEHRQKKRDLELAELKEKQEREKRKAEEEREEAKQRQEQEDAEREQKRKQEDAERERKRKQDEKEFERKQEKEEEAHKMKMDQEAEDLKRKQKEEERQEEREQKRKQEDAERERRSEQKFKRKQKEQEEAHKMKMDQEAEELKNKQLDNEKKTRDSMWFGGLRGY